MNLLTNVKNVATVVANSPKTPKALLIFGGVAIIGGTVWACVQTAKADKIVDDFKETIDDIKGMKEDGVFVDDDGNEQEYSQKSYTHDMIWAYGGFAKDMAIHYSGPVACLVGGITAIGMGYKLQINKILKLQGEIMSLNNEIVTLGAVAANAEENFRKYRDNVIADGGEELDEKYMHGVKTLKDVDVDIVDPDTGEIRRTHQKKFDCVEDISLIASPWAIFLDECDFYTGDPNTDKIQLERVMNIAQTELSTRKWYTMQEIYDLCGVTKKLNDKTQMSSRVHGWVEGYGEDFINIKMVPRYIGGEGRFKNRILIDFNCYHTRIDEIVEQGRFNKAAA